MYRSKVILYDFLNEDSDFKDSDKDFHGQGQAQVQAQALSNKAKRFGGPSRVMQQQLHPQAIRDDAVGLKEWFYDSKVGRVPIQKLEPDIHYHLRSQLF